MTSPFISFMTCFMVCENYEWIEERLLLSIDNIAYLCNKLNISYEILICEQIGIHNTKIIGENFRNIKNVRVIELDANYPSPLGYKYIEAYGKNECLKYATGEFSCIINSDILFSDKFFKFISTQLKHKTFYRFADYEVSETDEKDIEKVLIHCENNIIRLCNPGCFNVNPTWSDIGQKSGDIMLLDTKSFQQIRGYPINECHNHVDTSTCIVAMNNFQVKVPPKDVCVYTMTQSTARQGDVDPTIGDYEWSKCITYLDRMYSNPKTAICFYGFIAELPSPSMITHYINNILYNDDNTNGYDIYYDIPDQLTERSNKFTTEEQNNIREVFKQVNIKGNIYINFHEYDASIFFKAIYDNNINLYSHVTEYISVRKLSLYYNINKTINLLDNSSNKYDRIIVTRLDLLDIIHNINKTNKTQEDNVICLLRSSPYRAGRDNMPLHAEDRIFFGSHHWISKLNNFYSFCLKNWNDEFSNEDILYFFYSQYPGLIIKHNDDFSLGIKKNMSKYSNEMLLYYTKLYTNFKNKHELTDLI